VLNLLLEVLLDSDHVGDVVGNAGESRVYRSLRKTCTVHSRCRALLVTEARVGVLLAKAGRAVLLAVTREVDLRAVTRKVAVMTGAREDVVLTRASEVILAAVATSSLSIARTVSGRGAGRSSGATLVGRVLEICTWAGVSRSAARHKAILIKSRAVGCDESRLTPHGHR
jgi:hypothetical protein